MARTLSYGSTAQARGAAAVLPRALTASQVRIERSAAFGVSLAPGRTFQVLLGVIAALTGAHLAGQVAKYAFGAGDTWFARLTYFNAEMNLPTWYSTAALLAAAAILGLVWRRARSLDDRYAAHWVALAAIFLGLSIDETAALHERADTVLHDVLRTSGVLYYAWVVPALGFVAALGVAYLRFLRDLPPRTRTLFIVAAAVYVGGAVGMELLEGRQFEANGLDTPAFVAMTTIEELAEMLGVALFIYAVLDYAASAAGAGPQALVSDRAADRPRA